MSDKDTEFKEILRAWMNLKGETIESLADASGVSKSGIANVLSGSTTKIRGSNRKLLAMGLKIRPEDLSRMPTPTEFAAKSAVTPEQIIEDVKHYRASGNVSKEDLQRLLMEIAIELANEENRNRGGLR